MAWENWAGFAVAALLLGLLPGPGVVSIVGFAVSAGRGVALAGVAGLALGNFLAMTLSLAGVGAVLATSALAFSVLKWAGAAWLVALGIWTLTRRETADAPPPPPASARAAFAANVAVATFHPKTILFFVALAPQFIDAQAPYWPQAAILIATFVTLLGLTDSGYALLASRLADRLRGPGPRIWARRIGGGALVAAGVATAAARRS